MQNFFAVNPADKHEQQASQSNDSYERYLKANDQPSFYLIIELHNRTNGKKRLVRLKNEDKDRFVNIFNLVSCFRGYESTVAERYGDIDSGPDFIQKWVRNFI